MEINVEAVRLALAALDLNALPEPVQAELRPDIETIKAQLTKPSPLKTVLREAGASLRTVMENLAANVLTPTATFGVDRPRDYPGPVLIP